MNSLTIITIDGGAATGASTAAANVAQRLRQAWQAYHRSVFVVNTGLVFRAIALSAALEVGSLAGVLEMGEEEILAASRNLCLMPTKVLHRVGILHRSSTQGNYAEIETAVLKLGEVNRPSSAVAVFPRVRDRAYELLGKLVEDITKYHGDSIIVADGRDCGESIFPDAAVKVFLTVSPEEAARRSGETVATVIERDTRDSTREASPMKAADNAVVIDTTSLDEEAITNQILALMSKQMLLPVSP